ncbi:hypothetical protein A2Z33_00075 [Candidatus Gottesmanbacteria bacterium RBG_16_52_11]|uniref:Uncharacterized protein n=1 Tax=Candidatus Gottesmanbacteria bacterium RBG_16_52_11 TaxID=1798374 RepID=A0A1F5YN34_9BACT|nr:MAG: hypothetical protein A2Z33_00075 [Candidatus Gottesmanbacteria bacterium RBG_16_52_11]
MFKERIAETVHRHTPTGRYEEYRSAHDLILDGAQGLEQYLLETQLDQDARAYARRKVTRDFAVAAGSVGILGYGVKRFYDSGFDTQSTIGLIGQDVCKVKNWPAGIIRSGLHTIGHDFGAGLTDGIAEKMDPLIDNIKGLAPQIGQIESAATQVNMAVTELNDLAGRLPEIQTEIGAIGAEVKSTVKSVQPVLKTANAALENARVITVQASAMVEKLPAARQDVETAVGAIISIPATYQQFLERLSTLFWSVDHALMTAKETVEDLPAVKSVLEAINTSLESFRKQIPELDNFTERTTGRIIQTADHVGPVARAFERVMRLVRKV